MKKIIIAITIATFLSQFFGSLSVMPKTTDSTAMVMKKNIGLRYLPFFSLI